MGFIKSVLRGKYIAVQAYLRKHENSQINLNLHLKELEKEQTKSKISRRKEIIKNQSRNELNRGKKIEKINEIKSWFFEKIKKIGKPLARHIKKKREGPNQ